MTVPDLTPQTAPGGLAWPEILEVIRPILAYIGPLHLVGGAVRDAFLRRPIHDLDFVTPGDGRKWARKVANAMGGAYYPLDDERQVGRAIVEYKGERCVIDVAQYRGASLAEDLVARDFTINAMAVPLTGDLQEIIDPTGGLNDLRQKRLRQCSPGAIQSDPARALRAVRLSVALRLMIDPETRRALKTDGPQIRRISAERIRDEFMTMLGGPRPHVAIRTLDLLGLLSIIVPEVDAMRRLVQSPPHVFDVWEHTVNVIERMDGVLTTISPARTDDFAADSAYGLIVYLLDRYRHALQAHQDTPLPNGRSVRSLLVLAALLHDCGKPETRSVVDNGRIHFYQHEIVGAEKALARAEALALSKDEATRVADAVRHHMRPILLHIQLQNSMSGSEQPDQPVDQIAPLPRRTVHRFWKATGENGVDVCMLTLADYLGVVGPELNVRDWLLHLQIVGALLDANYNRKIEIVAPPPLVTGTELIAHLKTRPGPLIGRLLALISEAQAAGEIDSREQALALAEAMRNGVPESDESA